MGEKVGVKKYAILAAVFFISLAVFKAIHFFVMIGHPPVSFMRILGWVIVAAMGATLFTFRRKLVIMSVGIYIAWELYIIILPIALGYFNSTEFLINLLYMLTPVAAIILLVLALKGNKLVKKIWFVPAALLVAVHLAYTAWAFGLFFPSSIWGFLWYLTNLIEALGFAFLCLWYASGFINDTEPAQNISYATFDPRNVGNASATQSVEGGADKLRMYKELLDSGTITQDEFESKKKQILGL